MSGRVVVGMSGGVDSSVAALLLKEQGFQVECLFMKNWEDGDSDTHCSTEEDYKDALSVCDALDLPLHSVNFSTQYRERVFAYFLKEYQSGRTPNPDVLCNKEIKFKVFRDYALQLGADFIATGHYSRIIRKNGTYRLYKGSDDNKDQSYFLYLLGQKELSQSLFPLGEMMKPEVRDLARTAGLPTHEKKDSTGICFIGERNIKEFLRQFLPPQPGDIVTVDGTVVGQHEGLLSYTIGQRKGIGVGGGHGKDKTPWYVVAKDLERNFLIIVQGHDHPQLFNTKLIADQLHWINDTESPAPAQLNAKIRYRQPDQACTLESITANIITVTFKKPQFAIAPGQSVVFYRGDECLGGGIIEKTITKTGI